VKRRLRALAALGCVTAALAAQASEPARFSRVALLLPACEKPGLSASELRSAIALDLQDEALTLAPAGELAPPTDVLVRIEAACAADGELTLHAEFLGEGHERRVDLSELPTAQRARALSLSLAELLSLFEHSAALPPSSSEFSGEPAPPPAAPPAPEVAQKPRPPAAKSAGAPPPARAPQRDQIGTQPDRHASIRPAEWRLSLAPELRFFATTSLWGGRALLHYGGWSAGADLLTARQQVSSGGVVTFVVHASVAYSFVVLGSAERSLLQAGPRLGAGRTFMKAEAAASARASSAEDVYLDAAFGARYSLGFSRLFRVGLGAELGYARGPIGYADDVEVARTAGGFASLVVDAGVRL